MTTKSDLTPPDAPAAPDVQDTAPDKPAAAARSGVDSSGRPWTRVDLDNAITRGDLVIKSVVVRKPRGGDLRGTEMAKLYNSDVDSMLTVLPRISEPMLHKSDLINMEGEDLALLCGEVVSFLLPKSAKDAAGLDA